MLLPTVEFYNPIDNLNRVHKGIVADNKDPKKIGRIKCIIPGLMEAKDDEAVKKLPWCMQKADVSHGGSASSIKFTVPEKGSEVEITFPFKNFYFPVYGGVLFSEEIAPKQLFGKEYPESYGSVDATGSWSRVNKEDETSEYHHTSGSYIRFNKEGDAQVFVKRNLLINVDGETQLNIKKDFKTTVGGNIIITTEKNYTLKAKKTTHLSSKMHFQTAISAMVFDSLLFEQTTTAMHNVNVGAIATRNAGQIIDAAGDIQHSAGGPLASGFEDILSGSLTGSLNKLLSTGIKALGLPDALGNIGSAMLGPLSSVTGALGGVLSSLPTNISSIASNLSALTPALGAMQNAMSSGGLADLATSISGITTEFPQLQSIAESFSSSNVVGTVSSLSSSIPNILGSFYPGSFDPNMISGFFSSISGGTLPSFVQSTDLNSFMTNFTSFVNSQDSVGFAASFAQQTSEGVPLSDVMTSFTNQGLFNDFISTMPDSSRTLVSVSVVEWYKRLSEGLHNVGLDDEGSIELLSTWDFTQLFESENPSVSLDNFLYLISNEGVTPELLQEYPSFAPNVFAYLASSPEAFNDLKYTSDLATIDSREQEVFFITVAATDFERVLPLISDFNLYNYFDALFYNWVPYQDLDDETLFKIAELWSQSVFQGTIQENKEYLDSLTLNKPYTPDVMKELVLLSWSYLRESDANVTRFMKVVDTLHDLGVSSDTIKELGPGIVRLLQIMPDITLADGLRYGGLILSDLLSSFGNDPEHSVGRSSGSSNGSSIAFIQKLASLLLKEMKEVVDKGDDFRERRLKEAMEYDSTIKPGKY